MALHTRSKPGKEAEYESVHAVIPADLDDALRAASRDHPANGPWQARMAELLDVEDDYSGNDSGPGLVWELP